MPRAGSRPVRALLAGLVAALAQVRAAAPMDTTPVAPPLDDPFHVRGQLPLSLPFLDITPRSAFLLRGGEWRLDFGLAYENTMAMSEDMVDRYDDPTRRPPDGLVTQPILEQVAAGARSGSAYYIDGETLRASLEAAVGIGRRIEVGLTVPLMWHTSGFLDAPIEWWHDFWGFPDGGRPLFARDQYVVGYADGGRSLFLGGAPGGVGLGDVVLSGRFALLPDIEGRNALSAVTEVKLPTGESRRFDGSGGTDVGVGLVGSFRRGRSAAHFGGQYSLLGASDATNGLTSDHRVAFFAAYAFRVGAGSAIVGQGLVSRGPFPSRDGGDLGDPAVEIALGMRHAVGQRNAFEWALLENLTGRLNTPDVGAFLGWSWRGPASGKSP
jgi:hypothetical protein